MSTESSQGEAAMTTRRLWIPVLVGLLVAGMLSVGGGGAVEAAEPRLTTRTITVPAAAFNPVNSTTDFGSNGDELWTFSGGGQFTAPLFFEAPAVTIRRITLFVWDNSSGEDICVGLFRTTPASADEQNMGFVCSTGASTTDPAVFTQRTFTSRRVTGAYGPYLFLWLPGSLSQGYRFYGVRITYAY
jgi:hypothetical protein